MEPKTRIEGTVYRAMTAESTVVDEEQRIVDLTFSSEYPVKRVSLWEDPWVEILGHKPAEVDLTRFSNGAAVLYNHSKTRSDRIGATESATIKGKRGHARVRFSKRADIEDIWGDVKDGVLRNISVSYIIHERVLVKSNDDGPDEYRVTRWEPLELSLVDIPADPTVGVGRELPAAVMSRSENYRILPVGGSMKPETQDLDKVREEGRQAEVARRNEIDGLFDTHPGHDELRRECLSDAECAPTEAMRKLFKRFAQSAPNARPSGSPHIQAGYDVRADELFAGATDAILQRHGIPIDKPHARARDLSSISLLELARSFLSMQGVSYGGLSPQALISRVMTTSDFPKLLANVGEKSVLMGFNNPEVGTHRAWTKETTARDFKPVSRVAASETPGLDLIPEGGEFKYGKLTETGDTVALATYGKILSLSRQAIINDDTGALVDAARSFGQSAVRLEADIVYATLILNAATSDGTALFDADHGNVGTTGVLSVTTLGEARQLMRNQRGLNGESYLDIQPSFLLVPTALETVAEQLLSSIFDPAQTVANQQINPAFIRRLQLIADPRLDADSAARWYVLANPNTFGWFERIYLNNQTEPFVEEKAGWEVDDFEIKVRHDFAAHAFLHQGAVRNDGT